jgi:uncharacterized delta-60 repeat protein
MSISRLFGSPRGTLYGVREDPRGRPLRDRRNGMRRSRRPLVIGLGLWLVFGIAPAARVATNPAAGTIDTTFGSSTTVDPGRVMTDFRALPDGIPPFDVIAAVVLQPDGKIIAGGSTTSPNGDRNFALVRYLPNGVIDTSFGTSALDPGRVMTDFRPLPNGTRSDDYITEVVLQPDGKIVAGGSTTSPNGDGNFALVRYNPDGSIDTTFGSSTTLDPGRVITDFRALPDGTRSTDHIADLVLQPDGKIVAGGVTKSPSGDDNFALVRYLPNGVIDTSFGSSTTLDPGRVMTDFRALPDGTRSDDYITAIALQSDGKIVAGGVTASPNGDENFALARYGTNGVIDTTFGSSTLDPGRVMTDFRALPNKLPSNDRIYDLAIQPDGKIVAGGYTYSPNGEQNFALVRYSVNGISESDFGSSTLDAGRVITDFRALPDGRRSYDYINAIALQPDGKIVAGGSTMSPNGDYNFALVRYGADGIIDTSFGTSTSDPGRVMTDFRALPDGRRSIDYLNAILLQPDGKIVAAGTTTSPSGDSNFALVRYYGTPPPAAPPGTTPPPATSGKIDLTLTLSPAQVRGGSAVTGLVTLSRPAPTGGVSLFIDSDNFDVVTVPDALTIPAGASSGSFTITTYPVVATTKVEIYVDFEDFNSPIVGEPGDAYLTVTP